MRSTFKILFYVKKGSEKPNGNLPLMCRLTVDSEVKQETLVKLFEHNNGEFAKKSALYPGQYLPIAPPYPLLRC